ncbi:MAG TPA: hypothetical protein VM490_11640 [Armatimonadaceae bacterium]|nr:hypothetical protein [Armatimonadaceae bacterium]
MWVRNQKGRLVNLDHMVLVEAAPARGDKHYVRAQGATKDGEEDLTGPLSPEEARDIVDRIAASLNALDVTRARVKQSVI